MRRFFCLVTLLLLMAGSAVAGPGSQDLVRVNRLLDQELRLAKEKQLYFALDLPEKAITFRANGLKVVTLPILEWRLWGQPERNELVVLSEKESLHQPQRQQVQVPPKAADGTPIIKADTELQALELDDMPTSYQLRFDNGLLVNINSASSGFVENWKGRGQWLGWYLSRPLVTVWNHLHHQPYSELVVTLQPRDARLLYWSFTAGGRMLVAWPGL